LLCLAGANILGVPLSDVWLDVGTPESLQKARGSALTGHRLGAPHRSPGDA
jgi:NDP-sugar pyrophosphorylase family protein